MDPRPPVEGGEEAIAVGDARTRLGTGDEIEKGAAVRQQDRGLGGGLALLEKAQGLG